MGAENKIEGKIEGLLSANDSPAPSPLLRAFAPLHRTAMGIAWGVVCGGLVALRPWFRCLRERTFLSFGLLAQFFWGYSVSWTGVFIGLLWGFGVGFALGYGFALVRNAAVWVWLTIIRSRAEMDQYSDFLDHL